MPGRAAGFFFRRPNLIKIKNLVIDLDSVAYWVALSDAEYNRPSTGTARSDPDVQIVLREDRDDPIVIIRFVGCHAQ